MCLADKGYQGIQKYHYLSQTPKMMGVRCNQGYKKLPDTQPDGTQVIRAQYSNCRNSSQFVLYTIDGGGHA